MKMLWVSSATKAKIVCKSWALDSEGQIVKDCTKSIYFTMQNIPGTRHHF